MCRRWGLAAALGLSTLAGGALGQDGAELAAVGLYGSLTFEDRLGQPLAAAPADRAVRLVVSLQDAVTAAPPRGLTPATWIRPVTPGVADCQQAAHAFRVTRRLPLGTIDLNGIVMAASFADGALTLVDPRLDLATANILAALSFDTAPDFLIGLTGSQSFLVGFAAEGRLVAIDATDGASTPITGIARPVAAAPGSDATAHVADAADGSVARVDPLRGTVTARWTIGPDPHLSPVEGGRLLAWSGAGRALLLDAAGRQPPIPLDRPAIDAAAVVPAPPARFAAPEAAAVALARGRTLEIAWLDGPDAATRIDLGAAPDLLVAAPDGRLVFAIDRASGHVAAVDLASGAVTAVEAAGGAIGGATASDDALFVQLADQSRVVVLSFRAIRAQETPRRRDVALGPPAAARSGAASLLSLRPSPQALALNGATGSVSVVSDYDTMGDAPAMSAVALRGGLPRDIATVDRTLRETAPGRFEAIAAIPAGDWELVLTSGVGGQTLCLPFRVEGDMPVVAREQVTARLLAPADGILPVGQGQITLALTDKGGVPLDLGRVPVTLVDFTSGWKQRTYAERQGDGGFQVPVAPPRAGTYGLALHLRGLASASGMILEARER